ncbi:MAG: chromate transporter [Candidatus Eremiobacteraeota bacterium]|nr:chromate transporter [Candidatus Eremiobacteraeota bacterium]
MNSLLALAAVFGRISSTSFGGGQQAMIRRAVVRERGWLSEREYMEMLAIAQIAPGANPVNMAVLVGRRVAGAPGALVAFVACTLPGLVILLAIAALSLTPRLAFLQGALRGCAAAAVGLTFANALELTRPFRRDLVDLAFVAAAALAMLVLHASLAVTLIVLVPLSIALHRRARPS